MNQSSYVCTKRSSGEDRTMLRTIVLGSCVSVQGTFVRNLPNGKIVVRVEGVDYAGYPVMAQQAA